MSQIELREFWSEMDGARCHVEASGVVDAAIAVVPLWKRALDWACIILALPALAVLMAAVAALIKMVAPGPVLFRQERIGHFGSRFTCLKFRTMRVNADSAVHQEHLKQLIGSDRPMTKMDLHGDQRLIPLGSWLRASGLDELPQLINVLRGEMSLVGPRPCTTYEYDQYSAWHKRRFETLPGLTGLWQVSGKNQTTFTQMIEFDISYAETKSLGLDLKIMAKTIPVLFRQSREARAARRGNHKQPDSPL